MQTATHTSLSSPLMVTPATNADARKYHEVSSMCCGDKRDFRAMLARMRLARAARAYLSDRSAVISHEFWVGHFVATWEFWD